jgi:hypothetical protein
MCVLKHNDGLANEMTACKVRSSPRDARNYLREKSLRKMNMGKGAVVSGHSSSLHPLQHIRTA